MATRTNFYKTPAYAYGGQYKLSSILENLQSYTKSTGKVTDQDVSSGEQQNNTNQAGAACGGSREDKYGRSTKKSRKPPARHNPYARGEDRLQARASPPKERKGPLQKLKDRHLQGAMKQTMVVASARGADGNAKGSVAAVRACASSVLGFQPYEECSTTEIGRPEASHQKLDDTGQKEGAAATYLGTDVSASRTSIGLEVHGSSHPAMSGNILGLSYGDGDDDDEEDYDKNDGEAEAEAGDNVGERESQDPISQPNLGALVSKMGVKAESDVDANGHEVDEFQHCSENLNSVRSGLICEWREVGVTRSSGGDTQQEPEEEEEDGVAKYRRNQRFPAPGEPVCANCGRFGAYICDQTGEDVCSTECKHELINEQAAKNAMEAAEAATSFVTPVAPRGALHLPETELEHWNYRKHKWANRSSSLLTQRCWRCERIGHFAEDCVATYGIAAPSPSDPNRYTVRMPDHEEKGDRALTPYTPHMRAMYKRCKTIQADSSNAKCGRCCCRNNLAFCLDCGGIFCDGSGHLTHHLQSNPAHARLYSYKLKRQIKCSKPSCPVEDIYELYSCNDCLDKIFDRFYNMFNASWNVIGLKFIAGAFACEDHFDWHRVNCTNTASDEHCHFVTRGGRQLEGAQLSEFLF